MKTDRTSTPAALEAETVHRFAELIGDIRFAMLTTIADDGSLRSRPMAKLGREFDGDLWFFTDDGSGKVNEILEDSHVGLSFADPEKQKYVSVSGTARVVHDRELTKQFWTPAAKPWFPAGAEDPHLALLRVNVRSIEYWDVPSSKMVQLYGFTKAVLTGNRVDNPGEHRRVDMMPKKENL